jgi:hypothetical protein
MMDHKHTITIFFNKSLQYAEGAELFMRITFGCALWLFLMQLFDKLDNLTS